MSETELSGLEHAAREAKAAQERFLVLDAEHKKGAPSESLKWEWMRAMAFAEVDNDTFQRRATPELILELLGRVAELEALTTPDTSDDPTTGPSTPDGQGEG